MVLIIGHRGAPGYRPEHTASSYALALQHGVDAVEPDVVVTKDGVLVVRHENEISGTTDVADHPEFADRKTSKVVDGQKLTGWFTEDFTWAELSVLRCRERIARTRPANTLFDDTEAMLRLVDVLALLDADAGDVAVVIEIKHAHYFLQLGYDLADLVQRDIEAAGWADAGDRIIYESFELGVLDRVQSLGLPGKRVFLTESAGTPADTEKLRAGAPGTWEWYRTDDGLAALHGRVQGISVSKNDLFVRGGRGAKPHTNDFVARAHRAGLETYTWTLRPENRFLLPGFQSSGSAVEPGDWRAEWAAVLDTGIDGVFVDHPDLLHHL